jgi:hypothetical protein
MQNHRFNEHWTESQLIEVKMMKMLGIQFVLIVKLIRMKLMRVICTVKNMLNQEFQHCVESQLIEVMNRKMHWILFVLIVNVIQM